MLIEADMYTQIWSPYFVPSMNNPWLKHSFKICAKIKSAFRGSHCESNSLHGSPWSSICLMRNSRRYQTRLLRLTLPVISIRFLTFHTCWSRKMISDALSAARPRLATKNMLRFDFPARRKKKAAILTPNCGARVWGRVLVGRTRCLWSSWEVFTKMYLLGWIRSITDLGSNPKLAFFSQGKRRKMYTTWPEDCKIFVCQGLCSDSWGEVKSQDVARIGRISPIPRRETERQRKRGGNKCPVKSAYLHSGKKKKKNISKHF